MGKWILFAAAVWEVLLGPSVISAQENRRTFCDPADPRTCPGTSCVCVEDVFAITFEGGDSVLEIQGPDLASPIHAIVALDTVSSEIQGWSYGVHHDTSLLRLESVTFEGTDAARLFKRGFEVTSMDGISECSDDLDPRCTRSTPGGGYIAACVLSNIERVLLPLGRNSLSKAVYRLQDALAGPGPVQATIGITNRLKRLSSPPVAINLTNDGQSRVPRDLIDGWILVSSSTSTFHRGDPNGDGRINVTDAISLLLFLFVFGPAPGCLESADFDDDGRVDTTDPILILRWLFLQGGAPAFPGGPPAPCAADPGGEGVSLGCEAYEGC